MSPIRVEICIDSLESARRIERLCDQEELGLDISKIRLEVCSNLIHGGGLTPTMGLVNQLCGWLWEGQLMIMIRPRIGYFMYSEDEIETMITDINLFIDHYPSYIKGFVFGCLDHTGRVDVDTLKRLVTECEGYDVTFHRAFDLTPDWKEAIDAILSVPGVTRILTSGHATSATTSEGLENISQMLAYLSNPFLKSSITLLPGSGINSETLPLLREICPQFTEIHLSSSSAIDYPSSITALVRGKSEQFGFGEMRIWSLDTSKLHDVLKMVNDWSVEEGGTQSDEDSQLRRAKEEDERKERDGLWAEKARSVVKAKNKRGSTTTQSIEMTEDANLPSGIDVEELLRKDAEVRRQRRERSSSTLDAGNDMVRIVAGEGSRGKEVNSRRRSSRISSADTLVASTSDGRVGQVGGKRRKVSAHA